MAELVLFSIVYVVVSIAVMKMAPFTGIRKPLFAFSILLVTLGSMVLNMWLMDTIFPNLLNDYSQRHEQAEQLIKQGMRAKAAHIQTGDNDLAMLLTLPVTLIVGGLWYYLFRRWENKSADRQ